MRPLALAFCVLLSIGASAFGTPSPTASSSVEAQVLERQAKDDYNAVRRARYALRKTTPGTPEAAAARQSVEDAKQKLKADRLKLRDLERRLAERAE